MHFAYINTETMEYPVHEGDIRLLHPKIHADLTGNMFPTMAPFAPVSWSTPPEFNWTTQTAEELFPVLVNGNWVVQWRVRDLTPTEKARVDAILEKIESELAESE